MDSVISKVSLCINDNCWMNRLSISLIIAFSYECTSMRVIHMIILNHLFVRVLSYSRVRIALFVDGWNLICWDSVLRMYLLPLEIVFLLKYKYVPPFFFLIIDVLKKSTWLSFIKHFFNDISLSIFISQCLSTIFFNFFIWENTVNRAFKIDTSFLLQHYQ